MDWIPTPGGDEWRVALAQLQLGTVQAFLDANAVDYETRASTAPKSNTDVAEIARRYRADRMQELNAS